MTTEEIDKLQGLVDRWEESIRNSLRRVPGSLPEDYDEARAEASGIRICLYDLKKAITELRGTVVGVIEMNPKDGTWKHTSTPHDFPGGLEG